MKFNKKAVFGSVLVFVIVTVCLLASFWQFSRLAERKDLNSKIESRMAKVPFELTSPIELGDLEYRSVKMEGVFIEDKQVLVAGRSFESEPGFNILTPFEIEDSGVIVFVNRGWIPQPFGDSIIDGQRNSEDFAPSGGYDKQRTVVGMIRKNEPKRIIGNSELSIETSVSPRIDSESFKGLFDKDQKVKVAKFWIQEDFQIIDSKKVAKSSPQLEIFPKQIPPPELDERNHFSYAMQWLSFALVAIITWIVILRKPKKAV